MSPDDIVIALDIWELGMFFTAATVFAGWLIRLELLMRAAKSDAKEAKDGVHQSERRIEEKIDQMRVESAHNFKTMETTLREVIFRLGDKIDKSNQ